MDIFLGHDFDLSRSHDVIGHMANRSAICHFLVVPHCNHVTKPLSLTVSNYLSYECTINENARYRK